ncbi:PREDICTED: secreted phosphoprotein 24 [Dipodomys ordii]|uniref:Secreted phosphoprotein 24 n=1 Tax=Dipodomys ordii TaxID=10020 RepID=A0A1S3FQ07_DIPOR|nr:PREDICTED: secreted phosphoprotein 24 [Dipodomys ordii]
MEKWALKILVVFSVVLDSRFCSGFPVYDYDPSLLREALRASVAEVNSQALSPYLFRAVRNSLKRVNVLDEDSLIMNLEFSVRETMCLRDSGEDPSACAFQRGYYLPTAWCRSTVQLSAQQVRDTWAHCRWASTSESNSSEEMIFGDMARSYRWRNYLLDRIPDETRREQTYHPSLEIMRRRSLPGNRRDLNRRHRARMNAGFE